MSVLDGLWRPVFCVFCVMRVMLFAVGGGVSRFIVCKCVVCFVVSNFVSGVVVDIDARGVEWSRWLPSCVVVGVLSGGRGMAGGVVFSGIAVFSPRLWRLCVV